MMDLDPKKYLFIVVIWPSKLDGVETENKLKDHFFNRFFTSILNSCLIFRKLKLVKKTYVPQMKTAPFFAQKDVLHRLEITRQKLLA